MGICCCLAAIWGVFCDHFSIVTGLTWASPAEGLGWCCIKYLCLFAIVLSTPHHLMDPYLFQRDGVTCTAYNNYSKKMSAVKEEDANMMFCASCGTAGGDEIKLKRCTACHLVKYCSVKCQKEHRPKHKKECKKRAAELHDEILFKQPESTHLGDCPICCLPVPIDSSKSGLFSCCSKRICIGCNYVNQKREREGKLQSKCPFCRKTVPKTKEETNKQLMRRVEASDPNAIRRVGMDRHKEGDYKSAFGYYTRAAALGDAESHYSLSILYRDGKGVEKDKKRERHHAEKAAIGGHPEARYNLGCEEKDNDRVDIAAKHWIIAANLGYDDSLTNVKILYKAGYVSKDDFTAALRGYQTAINAMKSPQREEAYNFFAKVKEDFPDEYRKIFRLIREALMERRGGAV